MKLTMTKVAPLVSTIAVISALSSIDSANAAMLYDQDVTSNLIAGNGITNGAFTVDRNTNLGLEIGLRAKQRYPNPTNDFNSLGDGRYVFPGGDTGTTDRSMFNFEWSINTDYNETSGLKTNDYTYTLSIDYDPTAAIDFLSSDPVNVTTSQNLYPDHAFGDNTTAESAGIVAKTEAQYNDYVATKNLVQQSWNMGFFGSDPFDGTLDGIYSIALTAYDSNNNQVAQTYITIVPDANTPPVAVPEPSSSLLLGVFSSLALLGHRKRRG